MAAIAFAAVLPSLITWIYFVVLAKHSAGLQQTAYLVGKTLQFGFPVVWFFLIQRRKLEWSRPSTSGIALSVGFGLAIMLGMIALYSLWLGSTEIFASATAEVRAKVAGFGVQTMGKYLLMAVFYSIGHSFLEEYYYRWFIFGQLRNYLRLAPAVVLSSLAFMAHHVIVLAMYFGATSTITILFSLAIAFGGGIWALLYERSRSLIGPWLSHLLIDAGIFIVGYQMVAEQLHAAG
jgi:membrane protease YdiL (CAAX protease family)